MSDLKRYGLKWIGSREFVSHEMADGYWTPWHSADERIRDLESRLDKTIRQASIDLGHEIAKGDELRSRLGEARNLIAQARDALNPAVSPVTRGLLDKFLEVAVEKQENLDVSPGGYWRRITPEDE